jgi:RES domain-containing protein
MRVWRISNYADLSGLGGMVTEGRWNLIKTPIVYCADHPATALVEILVHLDGEDLPATFQLLEIDIPEAAEIETADLPDDWRDNSPATRRIGTGFVQAGRAAVMRVPSVIVPFANNYLLNPRLAKPAGVKIVQATVHPFDPRLVRQP